MRFEKIVLVTRRTRLEELIERYNSRPQAKFAIERAGGDFEEYQREDDVYRRSLDGLRSALSRLLRVHTVERGLVPTFLFTERDVVVTAGQDGLVANTAKYALERPIVAVNPDPARFDGVLLPFRVDRAAAAVERVLRGAHRVRRVTLAEARLSDGQRLLAFNDLFIGARTHVSARYVLRLGGREEPQSSSGIIVSTGAGSTGWLSSTLNMAAGICAFAGGRPPVLRLSMAWEEERLVFVVREPFASRASRAGIVAGAIEPGRELVIESRMASGGVIFSDGVEADYIRFDSGATAVVGVSGHKATLVVE
jgi:NAD kinase